MNYIDKSGFSSETSLYSISPELCVMLYGLRCRYVSIVRYTGEKVLRPVCIHSNLPESRVLEYFKRENYLCDPVVQHLRQYNVPVRWRSVLDSFDLSPRQLSMMQYRVSAYHDAYCFRLPADRNIYITLISASIDLPEFQPMLLSVGTFIAETAILQKEGLRATQTAPNTHVGAKSDCVHDCFARTCAI